MTDIRQREDVVRVVAEMEGKVVGHHDWKLECGDCSLYRCQKCRLTSILGQQLEGCLYTDTIIMSIGDLAFFMRDKCDKNKWFAELKTLCKPESWPQIMLEYTTPDKWVEAAVKSWDSRAADAAGKDIE